ncbi:Rv1733c family protein [Saccharopolyspora phatthalungensis]|uniref:Uncharacterized protein n=1 Tax=Saccharopolyspora phatthalungensis TaxID=664693 RepID=A0A840Q9V5_9PSEU|nr:hypothetical protein [Saccharopolyspora phatthalungensis]MBB5155438.1 hypothetical protein [Saccharopolyspora phatthalungensis]
MRADRSSSDLRCLVRRIFPGANPLRRRTDYFEPFALLIVALIAAVTVVVALFIAQAELRDRLIEVEHEQAAKHQVVATIVTEVGDPNAAGHRSVAVRWGQPPDERFAVVQLPPRAPVTGTLPVWLDQQGGPTAPPLTRADAAEAAGLAGAGVLVGSAAITSVALVGARLLVTRRRLAAWAAEWEKIGPQWRKHAP